MLYYLISLFIILIDQWSKWAIVHKMNLYESVPIIQGWLHITSIRNTGAAFSLLQNQRWFFIILTLIIVVFIVVFIHKNSKKNKLFSFALAFILGGAVGNLIDRVITGQVVDFIDVRIIHFAIFNIADSAITIGVGLLIIDLLFNKEEKTKEI